MENNKEKKIKLINTIIVSVLALSFLIGTMVYVNFIKDRNNNSTINNEINENICRDEKVRLVGTSNTISISEQKGKIVVINFWSTSCNPCMKEMPYFEQIANEYKTNVVVIAIHTNVSVNESDEKILKYISSLKWQDYTTKMGVDKNEDSFFKYLGGKDTLPYTVILDKDNKIAFQINGSTTYETLKEKVDSLL